MMDHRKYEHFNTRQFGTIPEISRTPAHQPMTRFQVGVLSFVAGMMMAITVNMIFQNLTGGC